MMTLPTPHHKDPGPFPPAFFFLLLVLFLCWLSVSPCCGQDAASRLAALKTTSATWSSDEPAQAAAPSDTLYLVTESWCGPCQTLKRTLKAEGIPYETLSMEEMKTRFNRTVNRIPYTFYVRPNDERVGVYGTMSGGQLRAFAAPLQLLAAAPARKARRTCRIAAKRTSAAALEALVTHLAVESGADLPMTGLADLHLPLNTKISDVLVLLSHDQQIRIGKYVTCSWKELSITSSGGRTKFNSPVTIEGRALGISLSASLRELYLHEDGRTLDVVIDGFPDLRVVFE